MARSKGLPDGNAGKPMVLDRNQERPRSGKRHLAGRPSGILPIYEICGINSRINWDAGPILNGTLKFYKYRQK